eukprot:1019783-Prymnesium_polylepis.1
MGGRGSCGRATGAPCTVHPAVIPECCAWAANCGCFDGWRQGGERERERATPSLTMVAGEGPMVPSLWVACPALCA